MKRTIFLIWSAALTALLAGCVLPSVESDEEDTSDTQSAEVDVSHTSRTPLGEEGFDLWKVVRVKDESDMICSGTLITNEWVLTARHCADKNLNGDLWVKPCWGCSEFVYVDTIYLCNDGFKHPGEVREGTEGVTRYAEASNCLAMTGNDEFDVALLHLAAPMIINGSTTGWYRDIYVETGDTLVGQTLYAVGFGANSEGSFSGMHGRIYSVHRATDGNDGTLPQQWYEHDVACGDFGAGGQALKRGDSGSTAFLWDGSGDRDAAPATYVHSGWVDTDECDGDLQYREGYSYHTSPRYFRDWVQQYINAPPTP